MALCKRWVELQGLDIADMADEVQPGHYKYRLYSMVCYYGHHYVAFILLPDGIWHIFDDHNSSRVGHWKQVINKCADGRFQASLLFYVTAGSGQ